MEPSSRGRSARAILGQPAWWIALAVLVFNDHALKGAGVLPGWLTGKLSDLAGLVVAPLLLVALVGARSVRARGACFAAVVVPFAAMNVSPAAAELAASLAGLVGLRWRVWADPTDLLALAVLPLAWAMSTVATRGAPATGSRVAIQRAGLVLGSLACIATSVPPGGWSTSAFLVNQTSAPLEVRVRWIQGELDCAAVAAHPAAALGRESFGAGITYQLASGDTVPLDSREVVPGAPPAPPVSRACDAALLQTDDAPDVVVLWRAGTARIVEGNLPPGTDPGDGAVVITADSGGRLRFEGTRGMTVALATRWYPRACAGEGDRSAYAWSDLTGVSSTVTVVEAARTPDGCTAATLQPDAPLAAPATVFLCFPAEAFPFTAGASITLAQEPGATGRLLRLNGPNAEGRLVSVVVMTDAERWSEGSLSLHVEQTDCDGTRHECGAFVSPAAVALEVDGDARESLRTGAALDLRDAAGRSVHVAVGRAEHVQVTHPACEPAFGSIAQRADVALVIEEAQ